MLPKSSDLQNQHKDATEESPITFKEILQREDLKGIERQIKDWTEDLKHPGYEERTVGSWRAVFR